MSRIDRLTALIDRFEMTVTPATVAEANLIIAVPDDPGYAWRLSLHPPGRPVAAPDPAEQVAFSAWVDWGHGDNPLFTALPETIERRIAPSDDLDLLVRLLVTEYQGRRCGAASVLNRLGEVLIVRIVREALERGAVEPGVLGGLADPRLSRVIVALHDDPGRAWRIEDLADLAGLSRSRFSELFAAAVGETPLSYLRRWRLVLARQDLERGDRVQTVARRYGYGSGEALNRAMRHRFGVSPTALKKRANPPVSGFVTPV